MTFEPSLSTCWCSHRHTDGYAMLAEIRDLGFSRVELSHGIPASLVPGILRAAAEGFIQFTSLHNFCPLPSEADRAAPNFYRPSAGSGIERRAWVRQSMRTLDLARRVGARHVVIHGGDVAFRLVSTKKIEDVVGRGDRRSRDRAMNRVRKRAVPALNRVEARIRTLLSEVGRGSPCLAIENREGILELPLDESLPEFLNRFDSGEVAYWHDTGHAEIKRRLGLVDPESLLEELEGRIAGFHLHDVDGAGRDHQPLGAGSIDFSHLRRFFRPHHHLVIELNPRVTREEVVSSRNWLLEFLN